MKKSLSVLIHQSGDIGKEINLQKVIKCTASLLKKEEFLHCSVGIRHCTGNLDQLKFETDLVAEVVTKVDKSEGDTISKQLIITSEVIYGYSSAMPNEFAWRVAKPFKEKYPRLLWAVIDYSEKENYESPEEIDYWFNLEGYWKLKSKSINEFFAKK